MTASQGGLAAKIGARLEMHEFQCNGKRAIVHLSISRSFDPLSLAAFVESLSRPHILIIPLFHSGLPRFSYPYSSMVVLCVVTLQG